MKSEVAMVLSALPVPLQPSAAAVALGWLDASRPPGPATPDGSCCSVAAALRGDATGALSLLQAPRDLTPVDLSIEAGAVLAALAYASTDPEAFRAFFIRGTSPSSRRAFLGQ